MILNGLNILYSIHCNNLSQKSAALSSILGLDLYLKKEYELRTGSFKERGARNALLKLSDEERKIGVIAASAGNHALALAYHGSQLGITVCT